MHKEVLQEFITFYDRNQEVLDNGNVAELGSYDINGNLKKYIPNGVGFDILEGPNVNVVIEPGVIPEEHRNKYQVVISISSFQCCPHPEIYKKEILDLLCDEGLLFLTMCSIECNGSHSTSPNDYQYEDSFRMTHKELTDFFGNDFDILEIYDPILIDSGSHNDTILRAKKK